MIFLFSDYLDTHSLWECLAEAPVHLFPPMDDRAAWEAIAPEDREDLLALADTYRDVPYPLCTATQFLAFLRSGSRTAHENPYFLRRRKLVAALMDMCATGATDALDQVIDGLWCICEETSWVISAHNLNAHAGARKPFQYPLPDPDNPNIDLFAAQTAMILSLTCSLLQRQLDEVTPMLRRRVRREIRQRILLPFMNRDDYWWMGFIRSDLCNWTPWIISNLLFTAYLMIEDRRELADFIDRALRIADRWLAVVPEDGGCDEGVSYWNMAGGTLLDCLTLLEQITQSRMTFWHEPKIRAILSFPEKMELDGGWFANFADCDARPMLSGERLQTAGERLGDEALRAMGVAHRGKPSDQIADVPHLTRLLMRLFHPAADAPSREGSDRDVWMPNLQVRILEKDGLLMCCKGGHNGESHNHNDVGSFMLYVDGKPAIVDAGNMIYTAKTFSEDRYTLWNTRSAYHNVPMIGDYEQQPGPEHAACDVHALPEGLHLNIAAAYGDEAGIIHTKREMLLSDGRFTLMDDIDLDYANSVSWVFLLREKPTMGEGTASFTGLMMRFDSSLTVRLEEIPITDARLARNYPGSLWRLVLTAPADTEHNQRFLVERQSAS